MRRGAAQRVGGQVAADRRRRAGHRGPPNARPCNPSITVVDLGPAFSATLANWAHAGGPPATIVITTCDGHFDVERAVTLKNAKPVSLTGARASAAGTDDLLRQFARRDAERAGRLALDPVSRRALT